MHGAIGLDGEEVGDLDRADLGDAAEIVAKQIDDHQILGALLLVNGEPGLEASILARRAPAGRGALHRAARQVLALAAEEQLGREREHLKIAGADQRAILHALLAAERRIQRDRIARKGEAIFEREVDLIDVAGGDVVLHLGEGVGVLIARPGKLQIRDGRALEGAVGVEPAPRLGIGEADGLAEEADPEERLPPIPRQQALQLRLEAIAELVGEEARGVQPARQAVGDDVEAGFHVFRTIDGDHPLRVFEQQRPPRGARGRRGQTVVEENEGSGGHVT